jgi:hypothetical protein
LIEGLVFHVVAKAGTLAQHVKAMTGKSITDGALSQRRALLPAALFEQIMAAALKPKAQPAQHPAAFYHGLRLCGLDGSQFSVTNTPQVKKQMRKAKSRRGRAAFPKVGVAVMVELGLHNPLAAAIGTGGESEMVLARRVLSAQPEKSLLIKDRYYGTPELLGMYGRRWEQELFYKELKVDMRSTPLLQSHTALTAMQEVAALILAYAVLVDYRIEAAAQGEVGVLRISFLKTMQIVQGLWGFLEVSADLMTPEQLRLVVRRSLRRIADMAIPKRRQRSCPRALRQPVSSWPRLRRNTYRAGSVHYSVGTIYA